jgi:hypothetical protein
MIRKRLYVAVAGLLLMACGGSDDPVPTLQGEAISRTRDAGAPNDAAATCEDAGATIALQASAPIGVGEQHLGIPYTSKFESYAGADGQSLFPQGKVLITKLNIIEHATVTMNDTRGFDAEAGGWGVSVTAGAKSTDRFGAYRAYQLSEVHEIDDRTALRTPPSGAAYYLSKIYYGHSFEMVVRGSEREFHAGVKAKFLSAGGSITGFARNNSLNVSANGRGMEPVNGDAIFAKTGEQVEAAYKATGDPVPIFAEYKSIPRACVPPTDAITWLEPIKMRLTYDKAYVYLDAGGTWTTGAKCTLNDKPLLLESPAVWSEQTGIGESCKSDLKGPLGDGNYCEYPLFWSTTLDVIEGDHVNCGMDGFAGKQSVPYAELSYTVPSKAEKTTGKFGNGNGHAEYWVFYSTDVGARAPAAP